MTEAEWTEVAGRTMCHEIITTRIVLAAFERHAVLPGGTLLLSLEFPEPTRVYGLVFHEEDVEGLFVTRLSVGLFEALIEGVHVPAEVFVGETKKAREARLDLETRNVIIKVSGGVRCAVCGESGPELGHIEHDDRCPLCPPSLPELVCPVMAPNDSVSLHLLNLGQSRLEPRPVLRCIQFETEDGGGS